MKKIVAIFFVIFSSTSLLSQKESTSPKEKKVNSLPESFLNLDLNYASISNISDNQEITSKPFVLKAMIGSKNSGLIVGFQTCTFKESFISGDNTNGITMRLGYQKSIFRGLYGNIAADLTAIKDAYTPVFLERNDRTILGWRLNTGIGYTFSFGKAKKIYLNTEMLYSVINKSKTIEGNMSLMAGLGFRFGKPAKTTYDIGTKTVRSGKILP